VVEFPLLVADALAVVLPELETVVNVEAEAEADEEVVADAETDAEEAEAEAEADVETARDEVAVAPCKPKSGL